MSDLCQDRSGLPVGRCGRPCVPGMTVCLNHASKDALAMLLMQTQRSLSVALTPETVPAAEASATIASVLAVLARHDPAQARRGMRAHDAMKSLAGQARADALAAARRAGAEAMREACAADIDCGAVDCQCDSAQLARRIRSLPLPGDPGAREGT